MRTHAYIRELLCFFNHKCILYLYMILFVVSLPKFADKQLGLLKKFYPKTNPEVGSYIVKGRGARGILPGSNSHDMPQVLEGLKDITIDYYMMIQYDICHPPIISKLDKVNMKSFYKSILHSLLTVYVFGSEVSDYIYPKIFVFWGTRTNCTSDILVAGSWQSCSHGAGRWGPGQWRVGPTGPSHSVSHGGFSKEKRRKNPWKLQGQTLAPRFFWGDTNALVMMNYSTWIYIRTCDLKVHVFFSLMWLL